jgi:hypothetical protein
VVLPPGPSTATEEYDGTNWTSGGSLNTARKLFSWLLVLKQQHYLLVVKLHQELTQIQQKNMMVQVGQHGGSLATARRLLSGVGTQTAGLAFGGNNRWTSGATEEYDGTVGQQILGPLNTARYALAGAGTQTAALAFGGYIHQPIQEQQKNMMVLLGQQEEI